MVGNHTLQAGACLDLGGDWLSSFPGWAELLRARWAQVQEVAGGSNGTGEASREAFQLRGLKVAGSFAQLLAEVRSNPRPWCAGTGALFLSSTFLPLSACFLLSFLFFSGERDDQVGRGW